MARSSWRTQVCGWSWLFVIGCQGADFDQETVSHAEQAINICNATASEKLMVDGIPAYAQCSESMNSAIYSNNGVDTATSAASSEWKRTQFSGGYQCTELVHRYWLFKWQVEWFPNGDAWKFCDATPPASSGIVKSTEPVHGDVIVFARGSCGADSTYGHVALVDSVDAAASKVTFVEQNNAGRRSAAINCASCFLHVVANDAGAQQGSGGAVGTTTGAASGGSKVSSDRTSSGGAGDVTTTQRTSTVARGGSAVSSAAQAVGGRTSSLTRDDTTSAKGGRASSFTNASSSRVSVQGGSSSRTSREGSGGQSRVADESAPEAVGGENTGLNEGASGSSSAPEAAKPGEDPTDVHANETPDSELADGTDLDVSGCACRLHRPTQANGRGPAQALALLVALGAVLTRRRSRER